MSLDELNEIINRLRYVTSGDIIEASDHNNLVDAVRKIREILSFIGGAGVANPCGYKLYDFIKNVCSNGDIIACEWITFTSSDIIGYSSYYSTDFITESFMSSHFYNTVGRVSYTSDVYIYPHRASNSVGYIDIDDLNLEYEKYVSISGLEIEEYYPILGQAIKYGEFGGVGVVLSVRVKSTENLNTNAPILNIGYGDEGYLTISLTPDMKIYVEYPGGSINIDYNINERWLFIVTNLNGWIINLYDESLNNISSLDYSSLSGVDINKYSRSLNVYKGYYSETQGKVTFQYDWIVIEANAITII